MDVLVPKVGEIIGAAREGPRRTEMRMAEQNLGQRLAGGISICGVTAPCPTRASARPERVVQLSPAWAISAT